MELSTCTILKRPSADGATGSGKKEHVRKKAWKPKTKTGCMTCRIRRVKCDEAKPECVRCTSTGRKCDGFLAAATPPRSDTILYMPKDPHLPPTPRLRLDSAEEQEALHFFEYHSKAELCGSVASFTFWQKEVLQASHVVPAIRHGIIALAALHRKFIAGRMPVVPDDTSDKNLRFALKQVNLSIREMNRTLQRLAESPLQRTTREKFDMMTLCILLYCVACFQGQQQCAFGHLRSGIKILREVDTQDEGWGIDRRSDHPVSLDTLRALFVSMDLQARGVMGDEALPTWGSGPKRKPAFQNTTFKTFAQARHYFEAAFNDVVALLQDLDVNPPKGDDEVQRVVGTYKRIQREFDERIVHLNQFLAPFADKLSREDRRSVLGVRLFSEQVKVYLRFFQKFDGAKSVREIDFQVDEQDMVVLLDVASQLLEAPSDLTVPAGAIPAEYYPSKEDLEHIYKRDIPSFSRPVFSTFSGLLSALWMVTIQAKSSALRRRATALLLDYPRREGVWDSVLAGRLAWECLIQEEIALASQESLQSPSDYVPDYDRFQTVGLKYVSPRVARIELQSARRDEAGLPPIIRHIAW